MVRKKSVRDQFIAHCRDWHCNLQFVLDRLGIKSETLHRWLRQPGFRRKLGRAMATARRRRDLEIELGANKAAERLTRMSSGQFNRSLPPLDVERLSSLNLVYFAHARWKGRKGPVRNPARGKPSSIQDPQRDLAHPDLAGNSEKLLAELEESRE